MISILGHPGNIESDVLPLMAKAARQTHSCSAIGIFFCYACLLMIFEFNKNLTNS